MSTSKGLLRGAKFNGRHSTVIEAAIPLVRWARKAPTVKKIALGRVAYEKGQHRVRVRCGVASVHVKVYDSSGHQELIFYSNNPQLVEKELQEYLQQS